MQVFKNKKVWLTVGIGLLIFFLVRISYVVFKSSSENFLPQKVSAELQPPKSAVTALVDNIKGAVKKEGRKDTKFQSLSKPSTLVEGEALSTENGLIVIHFPNIADLSLSSNTELDYLNGLPKSIVVRQPDGTVSYTVLGSIQPFSVRSLGLLIEAEDKGLFTVATDAKEQSVLVVVKSGSVTLAYSDANDTTQVVEVTSGRRGFFNYSNSTLIVR